MERRLEDFLFKLEEQFWIGTAGYLQLNLADAAIMVFPDPAGVLVGRKLALHQRTPVEAV